jgi:hypothetical protein
VFPVMYEITSYMLLDELRTLVREPQAASVPELLGKCILEVLRPAISTQVFLVFELC